MRSHKIVSIVILVFFSLLSGCYNKPIRHLASDAGLIKVGSSSRNDVLTYLGEPDKQTVLPGGHEEWIYIEEKTSGYQRTPVVGGFFEGKGFEKIFIVLKDDIVQSCQFRENDKDEFNWTDDYSWQEKKE